MRVKLKDAFNLQMGKTPSRSDLSLWGGNNKWISIADIGSAKKQISSTKECITDEGVSRSGIKVVPEGTVIMSFKLSIGKTAIVSEDMYTNEAIMAFIDNGTYCIDPNYLYHLCCGTDWTQGGNKAVMGLTLNKATLSEMEIELPTLEEQREIASILDQLDAIIEKRHDELNMIEQLVKSRFIELFGTYPDNPMGWETGTIRDIVTDVRYGSSRPAVEGGKYPYLRMNNITYGGELDLTDTKRIDIPKNELDKCTVRRGDVLFNRTNSKELVGKTCVYNRDEMMVLAGFVIRVRVTGRVLPEFLSAFLNTDFSKQMLLGMCKAAIGQANINAQEMQNIGLYLPPIELQRQFVQFKEQTDKSKYYSSLSVHSCQQAASYYRQEWITCRTSNS